MSEQPWPAEPEVVATDKLINAEIKRLQRVWHKANGPKDLKDRMDKLLNIYSPWMRTLGAAGLLWELRELIYDVERAG